MIDTTAVTARSCKISGCKGKLAPNNTTGYCHEHRGRSPHSKKTTVSGASVAVATVHRPTHAHGMQQRWRNGRTFSSQRFRWKTNWHSARPG